MKRKFIAILSAVAMIFGLSLFNSMPASAAGWYTVQGGCQVNSTHYLYAEQEVYVYADGKTYFGHHIVSAVGGHEIRSSIRKSDGTIIDGPRVGFQTFDFYWGRNVNTNYDPRVRTYYYSNAGGCNVVLNPPSWL